MTKKIARDYQIEDLTFLIKEKKAGLLHDPGCGKTLPGCLLIYYVYSVLNQKSFFVMPKSLMRKNRMELLECTNFTEDQIVIVDGTPKQREAIINDPNAKVFIMGFKRFADDWQNIMKIHPEVNCIVIDEWHMGFKSIESQRTKELVKFTRKIEYFVPMSGTLIDGRLDSCYAAIHIIEPRYYTNLFSFRAQHGLTDEYGRIIAWRGHDKIGRILLRHSRRKTFEQVYGKQDTNIPIIQHEICEMHQKQREAYKEFEDTAILELDDKFLEGGNPAVAAMRCRQIMAHPNTFGIIKDDELTGKEESLLVHIEDHINRKEPLLIFATLQPEQERIYELCKKAGLRTGLINGNVPISERDKIDIAFQKGELDCIVASPATASVGFNWGHVNHVIFTSLDYQNVNFVQAYRRAIRGIRTTKLRITILEYEDSIDQRIFTIVNTKSQNLSKVDSTYETLELGKKIEENKK